MSRVKEKKGTRPTLPYKHDKGQRGGGQKVHREALRDPGMWLPVCFLYVKIENYPYYLTSPQKKKKKKYSLSNCCVSAVSNTHSQPMSRHCYPEFTDVDTKNQRRGSGEWQSGLRARSRLWSPFLVFHTLFLPILCHRPLAQQRDTVPLL